MLQELQAKLALKAQQAVAGAAAAAAKKGSGGGGLFNFRGLITTILGNLQLKLSNVHVRCVPGRGVQRREARRRACVLRRRRWWWRCLLSTMDYLCSLSPMPSLCPGLDKS